jgi:hypothetical protein
VIEVATHPGIDAIPKGGTVVFAEVWAGLQAIPLIRQAKLHGLNYMCQDRWRRCLRYVRQYAPELLHDGFPLYVGTPLQAAKDRANKRFDAVIYVNGEATKEELDAWMQTIKRDGAVWYLAGALAKREWYVKND